MSSRLSLPEEGKERVSVEDRKQAPGSQTANHKQGGLLFCRSQPIVLIAEGENANPLWKRELGGFTLSILIRGSSLISGAVWVEKTRGEGGGRDDREGEESSRRGVAYSKYTVGAIWIFNTRLNGEGGKKWGVEDIKSERKGRGISEEATEPPVSQRSW